MWYNTMGETCYDKGFGDALTKPCVHGVTPLSFQCDSEGRITQERGRGEGLKCMPKEPEEFTDVSATCKGRGEELNFLISVPTGTDDGFQDNCFFTVVVKKVREKLMNRNAKGRFRVLMSFGINMYKPHKIEKDECDFTLDLGDRDENISYEVHLEFKR